MINIRYLKIIVMLVLIKNITFAQLVSSPSRSNEPKCGTVISEEQTGYMERTREMRESIDLTLYSLSNEVPIAVHVIIGGSDGIPNTHDFEPSEVETTIEDANNILDQVGIQLVRCIPINYISKYDNTSGITTQPYGNIYPNITYGSTQELAVAQGESVPDVVNIFIVYNLIGGIFDVCGWASFPGDKAIGRDWIFISGHPTDCSDYGNILAHEVGHYFNLYHTHSGAMEDRINELESRTDGNCGRLGVGDELCDTPADPYFNIIPDPVRACSNDPDDPGDTGPDCELKTSVSCQVYDNTVTPPVQYMPDPTNVMSYGHRQCRTFFSSEQIERFLVSLVVDRPELLSGRCDPNCAINENFDNTFVHNETDVDLFYVSEDITSSATVSATGNTNAITIYNAGESICLNPSFETEHGSTFLAFIDGCEPVPGLRGKSMVPSNSILSNLNVFPNPFSNNAELEFYLAKDNNLTVSVSDMLGNLVNTFIANKSYEAGKHQIPIDGTHLSSGIYYCTIQAGDHIETQKMLLTK